MLIATDVAARGLDVNNLTHVINYSLPDDPEVYTHRSGRTGRAGNKGISVVISNSREGRKIKSIENKSQIKFIKKEVPSGKDICSKQLFKLIEKIEKVKVDEKQISPFLPEIYEKLSWLSREDLIKHFVSAEFNRFLDYYKKSDDIKNIRESRSKDFDNKRSSRSFEILSINVGRKHGITPIELISLVNRITKSNDIEIGSIDIRQSYTVFEIDKLIIKSLIKSSSSLDYNGIGLNIKKSKEKIEKKYSRESKKNNSRRPKDSDNYSGRSRSKRKCKGKNKGKRRSRR